MGILVNELESLGQTTLSGDTTIHGTLTVNDYVDFLDTLEVSGELFVDGTATLTGTTNIGGTLTIEGETTINGPLQVNSSIDAQDGVNIGAGNSISGGGFLLDTGGLTLGETGASTSLSYWSPGRFAMDGIEIATLTDILAGTSGTSGDPGLPGNDGTSGTSGESGTSGTSGESGTSGTSGDPGLPGGDGTSGTSGSSATGNTYAEFWYDNTGTTLYVPNEHITGNLFVKGTIGGTLGPLGFPTYIFVGDPLSDFPTLKASIDWLSAGKMSGTTTLVLTADSETLEDTITINLPFTLMITSGGYEQSIISAGVGLSNKPMFDVQSSCSFTKLIMDGTNATGTTTCINVATDDIYIEVKDFLISEFNKGIFSSSNSEFWVMEGGISDCITSGFELNTDKIGAIFRSTLNDFSCSKNYNYTGINILSGHTIYISSENDTTELIHTGQTFIKKPGTGAITYTDFIIVGCIWNNVGTFKSGFDFTLQRDADIVMISNVGQEDQKPHAKINANNSTGTTILSTSWTKVNYTHNATTSYLKKFGFSSNNLTYYPSHSKDIIMWVSGSINTSTQPVDLEVCILKNANTGMTYGYQTLRMDQDGRTFMWSTNIYVPDIVSNDTLAIYFKAGGTETITLTNLNWLVLSQ